jgi:hypothetical protein
MTVQTLKLGRERFVILREKDYRQLKAAQPRPSGKARRLTARDKGDIAEAKRRLADPKEVPIPYEQVRKELGLA